MRLIILNILVLGAIELFGQVDSTDLIVTQKQNENWFIHLGQIGFKEQVELINRRVLLDTNVFIPNRYTADNLNGRLSGYCKPILVAGGIPFYIKNKTKAGHIARLTELLTVKTIKSIEIVSGEKATAIFGSAGECKVLVVTMRKKSTKRRLARLEKKMQTPTVTRELRWKH